jgi:hypothetical protein
MASELYVTDATGSLAAPLYRLLGHGCPKDSSTHVYRAVKYLKKAYATTKRNIARFESCRETKRLEDKQRELEEALAAT